MQSVRMQHVQYEANFTNQPELHSKRKQFLRDVAKSKSNLSNILHENSYILII